MDKLAILGGSPVRETFLSYGRQYIDDGDIKAVEEVLKSDFLTCGPLIPKTEEKICEITGAKHAIMVSNGTTALHCACLAAGISKGDEVIVTPITFAASANCVLYCGGTPIFADIDKYTWEISPEEIEKKITKRTKAVLCVDYTGQPCDYEAIKEICNESNLTLIEDAAHAIGTKYRGKSVGSISDLTTFSFHPVKTVTAGEGGAITANNEKLYNALNLVSKHGITHEVEGSDDGWYYEQIELGNNYRITDFQCALLSSQLNKLDKFIKRRDEISKFYTDEFKDNDMVTLQRQYSGSETARHLFVIRLNLSKLKVSRREIYDALRAENIGAGVHYIPVYYFPYYKKMGYRKGICPNAEWLYEGLLTLPLHYSMTDEDAADVVRAVKKVLNYYKK